MAVNEVNLNEITSIKGDEQSVYGSPVGGNNTVLGFNPAISYINAAAQAKANANQFKYLQFQANLKDFYTTFNDLKVDGVMEKDYPLINEEYANLAGTIAESYDIIRNPMKDPEKFAEIKEREARLRGMISRSKQDMAYRDSHMKFVQSHPEFNTDDNKALLQDFSSKELGNRQLFNLNTPFVYDPSERAKIANSVAQTKLKQEQAAGKYISSQESLQYLETEYDNAWDALGTTQDKSGRPVIGAAQDAYSRAGLLSDPSKLGDVDRQVGRSLLYQDNFVKSLRPNEVELQEDQQKFSSWQNSLNRGLQRELAKDKELDAAGRDYNEALTSGFSTGYVRPALLQGLFGDASKVTLTTDAVGPDGVTMQKVASEVPKIQVIGSELGSDGKIVVKRVDNTTGKPVPLPDISMSFDEAREAFKNIAGANNAGKVADAAEEYRKRNKLGLNPELDLMQKHFDFNQQGQQQRTPKKVTGL